MLSETRSSADLMSSFLLKWAMPITATCICGFDGEQLAADVGPGKPSDDADLVLVLDLAVAVLRHAEIIREVIALGLHLLLLRQDQFFDRLADQGRELALEVAYACLARVAADDGQ